MGGEDLERQKSSGEDLEMARRQEMSGRERGVLES